MGEAHVAKCSERGADIGASNERATAAVDDQICRPRKGSCPFLQVGKACFGGSRAVKRSPGDVPALEQRSKPDIENCRSSVVLRGKLFDQVGGLHQLCRRPW